MSIPKLTVIVPIFGVEKYIERCARSLFEQTLDNMEFIFVDDCTKDNSIAVLEKVIENYPNRKKQIAIIHHEENKGLPQARKTGIMQAKGEYIAHCDSDDWVDNDMYRQMYEKATTENLDIVFCDFFKSHNGINTIIKYFPKNCPPKPELFVQLYGYACMHTIWGFICKKNIYNNNLFFPCKNFYEDYVFTIQLVYYASSLGYIQEPLYYYCVGDSSMTNKVGKENRIKYVEDSLQNLKLAADFATAKKMDSNYVLLTKILYQVDLWSNIRDKKTLKEMPCIRFGRTTNILFNRIINPVLKFRYYMLKFRLFRIYDFVHRFIISNPHIRNMILSINKK